MERIGVVNGLRGLAIIGVLFQHIGLGWAFAAVGGGFAVLRPLFSNGWTGVNLFFILSGFVLFLPYAAQRRTMATWLDIGHFYRARFLRLMPLYYFAGVILLLLAGSVLGSAAFNELAIDLTTVRFVLRPYHFGVAINFPLWSIGVEILFSIVFPAVVIAIARVGLVPILAAAVFAALAARVEGRVWDIHPTGPNFISDNIFGRIDEFVIGMALARWHVEGRIPSWARHLMWPGVVLILLAWAGFYQCQYQGASVIWMAPLNNVLDLGFVGVLAAALTPRDDASGLLTFAPLQVAGMMCYSLYIWHAPVMDALHDSHGLVVALPVLIVLAAFSYRYIEFGRVADWRRLFLWPSGFVPARRGDAGEARTVAKPFAELNKVL
jgi:peptidoglycan/LPS O-acetylase OafA/YrhL